LLQWSEAAPIIAWICVLQMDLLFASLKMASFINLIADIRLSEKSMGNWFDTDTKKGKASFDEQMIGLDSLRFMVKDKAVFDLGCAEGQIAAQMLAWGAKSVHGVDNRSDAVAHALSLGVGATVANADTFAPRQSYDIMLMLGVLHKLKDPAGAMGRMMDGCRKTCVIRLPNGQWPILRDGRSGNKPINLKDAAIDAGFRLYRETDGPHGQWVGYLSRFAD
jgi:SAM-dependent methyltransferase